MHKCVVCNNNSRTTRTMRPDIVYHSFPKNEYIKKRWLNIFGMQSCEEWTRVCSEHFLKENYKPGKRLLLKNTLPQPFNQNVNDNNVSINNNTQINDVPTQNNEGLPISQDLSREEHVENIIVNNVRSPRRSIRTIRLTTTNEDMSYENMPRLHTERLDTTVSTNITEDSVISAPILPITMDFTIGNGQRCSIQNCFNRHSKYLSVFGYPKDLTLKKMWMEQCGLRGDPTMRIKANVKVCGIHFEDKMFVTPAKRNRLKADAFPSLFLDITDERNVSLSNSSINNGFASVNEPSKSLNNYEDVESNPVNKPSTSSNCYENVECNPVNEPSTSSNYFEDVESNPVNEPSTSSNYYEDVESNRIIGQVNLHAENLDSYNCSIPDCITNDYDEEANDDVLCLFTPSINTIKHSRSMFGVQLTERNVICEKHYRPEDIITHKVSIDAPNNIVKTLVPNALPFATNDVPIAVVGESVLKTPEGQFKRSRVNDVEDHSSTKKVKNNLIDKSNATTKEIYISENDDNDYTSTETDIQQDTSSIILNPILESNIVKINTLPNNTSNTSKSSFEKILANSSLTITLKPNDEKNMSKQITAIDNTCNEVVSSCIEMPGPNKFIVKTEQIDDDVARVYTVPISYNRSMIDSNLGKTFSNSLSDISQPITVNPTTEVVFPAINKTVVKIEPNNGDMHDLLQTNFEQQFQTAESVHNTLPSRSKQYGHLAIKSEPNIQQSKDKPTFDPTPAARQEINTDPVLNYDTLVPSTSIDNLSSNIISDLNQKLKKIAANSSVSICLKPIDSIKLDNPSKKVFSKSSTSISLQPKLNHNLSSTTSNYSPSVTLQPNFNHNLPSTSSSSVNNTAQSTLTQFIKPESDQLSKLKPDTYKMKNILIDNSVSFKSIIDFEKIKLEDSGFIHEISENIYLPNFLWQHIYNEKINGTGFIQYDGNGKTNKKIMFENSLTPTIDINGKEYNYNKPISSKNELQNLIDKLDTIEICAGYDGFVSENCTGYYEYGLYDTEMCSACQDLVQIPKVDTLFKSNTNATIEDLKNKLSDAAARVSEFKKNLGRRSL